MSEEKVSRIKAEEKLGPDGKPVKEEVLLTDVSVEEWIENQTFTTTGEVEIPEQMSDRVIGQDRAVDIMKKAAAQKRHMMLIGEPGTGKSMLANSMVEHLPRDDLQDIVAYANPEDENEPRIRVFPAGKGKAVVQQQKIAASQAKNNKNVAYMYAAVAIVILGFLGAFLFSNFYILFIALFAVMAVSGTGLAVLGGISLGRRKRA